MHRHPKKYSPPPRCQPLAVQAVLWSRGEAAWQRGGGTQRGVLVGARAGPMLASPHWAIPYGNPALGCVTANSQLKKDHALKRGTERHQCTTQHTLAESRWTKACEPLRLHCHCFTSPLWSQADVARSELGSVTLPLRLLQLTRAHCAFWGMQAKATGTRAEILTLKHAAALFIQSWKYSLHCSLDLFPGAISRPKKQKSSQFISERGCSEVQTPRGGQLLSQEDVGSEALQCLPGPRERLRRRQLPVEAWVPAAVGAGLGVAGELALVAGGSAAFAGEWSLEVSS